MQPTTPLAPPSGNGPADSWSRGRVALAAGGLCLLALALHLVPVLRPMLIWDDFQILAGSWTWQTARANLWVPFNEHVMPLGRISTWVLIQIAGRPTALPQVTALQGPLAVLAGMILVYLFIRRELGRPFYGLMAMALFGVTTTYGQAVRWFAASFAVLALDTFLLALLAAQAWRRTGRRDWLAACGVAAALAPCWFASGVLAGPWCAQYLLPWPRDGDKGPLWTWRQWLPALVPLAGSLAFVVLAVTLSGEQILHTPHYGTKNALEASDPWVGLHNTGRAIVDSLLIGFLGIGDVACPVYVVWGVLVLVGAALAGWASVVPHRRLLMLGLAVIVASYWLTYSARAAWSYESQLYAWATWSRYHLFPQLGLTWVLCAGLPRLDKRLRSPVFGWLGSSQVRTAPLLAGLGVLLFLIQLPRGLGHYYDPRQIEDLRAVEEMDHRCREAGISAHQAREILRRPGDQVSGSSDQVSRWEFLRGSDRPVPRTLEEVRRCLQ